MRGKPISIRGIIPAPWITPADAGKTYRGGFTFANPRDHPRGCGENLDTFPFSSYVIGSPPRMRGKLHINGKNRFSARITPADAGKTAFYGNFNPQHEDHPRGCGENWALAPVVACMIGSPPRMRGKPRPLRRPSAFRRITPADAGKTMLAIRWRIWYKDHPRGCGENYFRLRRHKRCKGSPPRMRGKHYIIRGFKVVTGITPADAGKTDIPYNI